MSRETQIEKRYLQLLAFNSVALLILTREMIVGALSPRAMAFAVALLAAVGWLFLTISFTKEAKKKDQGPNTATDKVVISNELKKTKRSIIALHLWLAILVVSLINVLWATKEDPLLPRLIGASVNLLLSWALVIAIRRQKTKLNGLASTVEPPQLFLSDKRSETL